MEICQCHSKIFRVRLSSIVKAQHQLEATKQEDESHHVCNHCIVLQGSPTDTPELDNATEAFGDCVDNENKHAHTVCKDEKGLNAKRAIVISPASADSNIELNDKIILPTECHVKCVSALGSVTGKHKVEEVDILYDSEPDEVGAPSYKTEINDAMPRDVEDVHRMRCKESRMLRTTASTLVRVVHEPVKPQQKKVKVEKTKYMIVPSPMDTVFSTSDASTSSTPAMLWYNEDSYIIKKKKKKYTIKDLLVPSNDSAQPNVWVIPEESLVSMVQIVWNTMFPHVKYKVTADSSVMAIIQQCLAEWHSGIGSAAICIVIDFFSKLDDNMDIIATVEGLLEDYAFLCETPGKPSSEGMCHSPFLIELLGTAHLNDTMGYIDIPQLSTRELAAGKDMAGVIGMASVAKLECAVKYIVEGIIDVDKVLADMMEAGDGKIRFKLPRVLNKATGKNTSTSFNFSWSNWGVKSMAYMDLIVKCGPEWLHTTVEAAQQAHQLKVAATSSMTTDDHAMEGVNPHALLSSPLYPTSSSSWLVMVLTLTLLPQDMSLSENGLVSQSCYWQLVPWRVEEGTEKYLALHHIYLPDGLTFNLGGQVHGQCRGEVKTVTLTMHSTYPEGYTLIDPWLNPQAPFLQPLPGY
ncbi:hypothetical protein EDD16DRAFT_1515395 [Pisolithus croceorrhizus]|nr:hypothetical protein EDD16DRAFT_1515395 [Pisolithus croceorrhizus]KAI6131367.1 hypothetical protein EV401DRAFT_1884055 [Pisolithus croceorrhizus]KAI6161207.1 hypothetical protein EDD17DRAFT_1509422 [Pisolithus thermaeus]